MRYKVEKAIENVTEGKVLPWFGQPGKGIQYELPQKVQWYLDKGYLKEIGD
ncbi:MULTISPECIES: TNT domain-containing protein [Pasteurellaceae]|uniref:TNT domain-containing protein n=1 Tax=Pasteurellaceae TaxID=712 RepID=UPI00389ADF51